MPVHTNGRRRISVGLTLILLFWIGFIPVIAQLPAVSFQHLKRDIDLFTSSFNALAEDEFGFIWFGSLAGSGLYRYDGYHLMSFLPDPASLSLSLAGTIILDVYPAPDHNIYVGTNFGFSIVDAETGSIRTLNNRHDMEPDVKVAITQCFLFDTLHQTLWIGTGYGLAKMRIHPVDSFQLLRPTSPVEQQFMPENIVRIIQDPQQQNILWLGTSDGLFSYDIVSGSYTHIPDPVAPGLDMAIAEMYQYPNGEIWMVAGSGFVLGYHSQKKQWKIHRIPILGTIPEDVEIIFEVVPAGDDEAWVGTYTSVGKLNLTTGDFQGWEHSKDRPEGLLPNGRYRDVLNDRHGRLWIASWYGVQYARQAFMQPSESVKNIGVAITRVEVSPEYGERQERLMYTQSMDLRKDQRDVTFQYVLPNPLNPAGVTYQYMLSGYDNAWITTDQRRVRYPNIGGGTYRFLVRARESGTQHWTNPASLQIHIPKLLTEFVWFWILAGGALLLLAAALSRWLIVRAKKQERIKARFEHQVSEIQMQALRAQMNPHFLFNSLNSIKYFAIKKSKEDTAAYLSKFSLLVRSILNNSKSRTISLKDELDALQIYIEIEHLRLDNKFDYSIDIDSGISIKHAQIPPMILQPYVENAIWHGLMHMDGRGKLLIQVKDMGDQVQCIIEDNGIGRTRAAQYRGDRAGHKESMGMQITSDRIGLINSIYHIDTRVNIIDLTDEEGQATGTRVVINIPFIGDDQE